MGSPSDNAAVRLANQQNREAYGIYLCIFIKAIATSAAAPEPPPYRPLNFVFDTSQPPPAALHFNNTLVLHYSGPYDAPIDAYVRQVWPLPLRFPKITTYENYLNSIDAAAFGYFIWYNQLQERG